MTWLMKSKHKTNPDDGERYVQYSIGFYKPNGRWYELEFLIDDWPGARALVCQLNGGTYMVEYNKGGQHD
jgi:hypothetical protein